jgi:hypothetical protein
MYGSGLITALGAYSPCKRFKGTPLLVIALKHAVVAVYLQHPIVVRERRAALVAYGVWYVYVAWEKEWRGSMRGWMSMEE